MSGRVFAAALCVGLVAWCACATLVAGAKAPPENDPAFPPPLPQRPISAFVQMQMIEIAKIDGVEQAFRADFYMLTSWYAPLAGTNQNGPSQPPAEYTGTEDLTAEGLAGNFWSPQLEFINARDEVTRLVEEPYYFGEPSFTITDIPDFATWTLPAGHVWIIEDQRYQCDFTTPLSMQDFPFDMQYMQLLIESFWYSDQMTIYYAKPNSADRIIRGDMDIVGWEYQETIVLPSALGKAERSLGVYYEYNKAYYDRLTVRALLRRQPDFYLSKIVAGCILLVFMCVFIFALAIDEADRMMGTLSTFLGLVTFLFVASGDTPKVPYQTRLDLFMLWCFFNVAFMLIIHAVLYYWRECDIEELLEEREKMNKEELERMYAKANGANGNGANELEMGVASPSGTGQRVYVNEPATEEKPKIELPATIWRVRHDEWADFSLGKWFKGLHLTRKIDAVAMISMAIIFSIGTAVILARAVTRPDIGYATWNDPAYQYNGAHCTVDGCPAVE